MTERAMRKTGPRSALAGVALALALCAAAPAGAQDVPQTLRQRALQSLLGPLSSVPLLDPGARYLADRTAAQQLGKALFWDQQLGSDGQACASCHFHAGADSRSKNQLNPGFRNETFHDAVGGDNAFGNSPLRPASTPRFGPNYQLTRDDFPLHKLQDDTDQTSLLLSDTNDVVSSQGAFAVNFTGIGFPADTGTPDAVLGHVFDVGGAVVRSVAPRNTPSAVNAAFNRRSFWDSRARDTFNGADPIGELDPDATVVSVPAAVNGTPAAPRFVKLAIPGSSAASQAVGPPLSNVEMSYGGRQYADLGRKMLSARLHPLAEQLVAVDDSLLGDLSLQKLGPGVTGIRMSYADLVRQGFPEEWWNAPGWKVDASQSPPALVQTTLDGPALFTVMEWNFALFFGLAVQEYEKTLRADQTPFDRFLSGDATALSDKELIGLDVFIGRGRCKECHSGHLLSNASITAQDTAPLQTDQLLPPHNMERMIVGSPCSPEEQVTLTCPIDADPVVKVYDAGFYNIGVRPTEEDLGVGAKIGPLDLPLSHAQRATDCVTAKAPPGSTDQAVRQANLACATPRIAARPIEAATVLLKAWSLASVNGLEGDVVRGDGTLDRRGASTGAQVSAISAIGDLIAQSRALLTGNPLTGAAFQLAACPPATQPPSAFAPPCPFGSPGLLFQARDLLAAAIPTLTDQGLTDANRAATCPGLDPAASCVQQRVANLLAAATLLLPDPVNPGPGINAAGLPEAFAPPIQPGERTNVRGAFKVPGLRNVELTAPFFHNGGQATLEQVVQFYDRGGDFARENLQDLDPNIAPIHLLPYEEEGLVAFMKALTDDRVKWERAPFDHPSLSIPNGGTLGQSVLFGGVPFLDDRIVLPAAGAGGNPIPLGSPGTPLANFPDPVWSRIAAVSGAGQQAAPGAALPGHLVVEVRDADGKPVPGVAVTFHAPPGGAVSPAQATTGADGRAEAAATLAPGAGAQTFQAEAFAVVGSPLALAATAVPSATAPPPVTPSTPPGGIGSAPTTGCASAPGGGLSALLLAAAALLARRRRPLASARRAVVAAAAVSAATLAGCGVATPDSPVADPARSTLTAAPASLVADGAASATIAVVARDAKGAPLAGRTVSFTVSGSGNALSAARATTAADGSAAVTLASTKAEPKTVTASVAGVALAPASVTFVPGPPSAARSALTPADPSPVVGAEVALTAAVRDAQGNPVPGVAVVLVAPDATSLAQPAAPTDGDGQATGGKLSATSLGPKVVTALVGGAPIATATVAYVAYHGGTFCGGFTVDVSHDAANCGACGNACGAAQICSAGACVTPTAASCGTLRLPPGAPAALVGQQPTAIAAADLDGDGVTDLAVLNAGDATVSILLGLGGGIFATAFSLPVGAQPVALAAADVDGDGSVDLVVVNGDAASGTVTVLLGNGSGTFFAAPTAQPTIAVGRGPASVTVADVDGDGHLDLVVPNKVDGTVSVLLNDPAKLGTLKPQPAIAVGPGPVSVAVADLDGQGKPDLAVANQFDDTVTVVLHAADGTFTALAPPLAAGQDPKAIVALDVDGDGKPDLAVLSASAVAGSIPTLRVFLNTTPAGGALAFAPPVDVEVRTDPAAVIAADLDGDGRPDLVVPSGNDDAVLVLLNRSPRGAANFDLQRHAAGFIPVAVAAADLDGDGKPDLAVASVRANAVTLLPNLGGGAFAPAATFQARPTYTAGPSPDAVAAADLDGDGKVDVAVANGGDGTVTVFRNRGDGALLPDPQPYPTGGAASAIVLADLHGAGRRDIAVADAAAGEVSVLRNLGSAGFDAPSRYSVGGVGAKPVSIAAADVNGDGAVDLVVANAGAGGVAVLLNDGHGAFLPPVAFPAGSAPSAIVAADLDGDGVPDLAVADATDGTVSVLRGNPDPLHRGAFLPRDFYGVGKDVAVAPDPVAIVAADLDGDGHLDLAVANAGDGTVSVLVNTLATPGKFNPSVPYGVAVSPRFLAAADLDKDGLVDLVVASGPDASAGPRDGYRALTVLMNDPRRRGTLFQRAYDQLLVTPLAVAAADLDGNGRADVVLLGSEGLLPLLSVCAP